MLEKDRKIDRKRKRGERRNTYSKGRDDKFWQTNVFI